MVRWLLLCFCVTPLLFAQEEINPIETPPEPVVHATARFDSCGGTITLQWKEPVTFEREIHGKELLLRVNREIRSDDYAKIAEQGLNWIDSIETGYNTLLIRASRPVNWNVLGSSSQIRVIMMIDECADEELFALELTYGRLLVENRKIACAEQYLHYLIDKYPQYGDEIFSLWGRLREVSGRWISSLWLINRAHDYAPFDEGIAEQYVATFYPHTQFVEYKRWLKRTVDAAAEQRREVAGEILTHTSWNAYTYLGLRAEFNHAHISEVTKEDGTIEGFLGGRTRGNIYFRRETKNGEWLRGDLYIGEDNIIGVGAEYRFLRNYGQGVTGLRIDYQKPYWDIFESIVENGTVSRIRFEISEILSRRFEVVFASGPRYYNLPNIQNAATSIEVDLEAIWRLHLGNPSFSLIYFLDAEYVLTEREFLDAAGTPFNPINLLSREDHTLLLSLFYTYRDHWEFNAFGGVVYNRLGNTTYAAGTELRYYSYCGPEVILTANRFPSTTEGGEVVDRLEATFRWRF